MRSPIPSFVENTFCGGQHDLLVGIDVTKAALVEAFQLALEVDGYLGQVLERGGIY